MRENCTHTAARLSRIHTWFPLGSLCHIILVDSKNCRPVNCLQMFDMKLKKACPYPRTGLIHKTDRPTKAHAVCAFSPTREIQHHFRQVFWLMDHPPERLLSFRQWLSCSFVTNYSRGCCAGFSPASLFKQCFSRLLTGNYHFRHYKSFLSKKQVLIPKF